MGTVVGLTFLFGFGNVLNLALRLGVPVWVAPLVAPAVDLSILGLLLGTRHLALTGASVVVPRPARRLLIFASVVTLALNVAELLVASEYGEACAWLAAGAIPGGRVLRAADNMADAANAAHKAQRACKTSSFIPGTKVSMADGITKPIEVGASCRVAVRPRTAWR